MSKKFFASLLFLLIFLQGSTEILLPSASTLLTRSTLQSFSLFEYGTLILLLAVGGILGSTSGAGVITKKGYSWAFAIGIGCYLISIYLLLTFLVSFVLTSFNFLILCGGQFFLGAAVGFSFPVFNGLIWHHFSANREKALTAFYSAFGAGSLAIFAALKFLLGLNGFIWLPFLTGIGFMILFFLFSFSGIFPSQIQEEHPPLNLKENWPLFASIFFFGLSETLFLNWTLIYAQKQGLTHVQANLEHLIFWFFFTVSRLLAAQALRWISARKLNVILPCLLLITLAGAFFLKGVWELAIVFATTSLFLSSIFPLQMIEGLNAFSQSPAYISGKMVIALFVGLGLGSFTFGLLHKVVPGFFLDLFFPFAFLFALAMFIFNLLIFRGKNAHQSHTS